MVDYTYRTWYAILALDYTSSRSSSPMSPGTGVAHAHGLLSQRNVPGEARLGQVLKRRR